MKIRELMTRNPVVVPPGMTIGAIVHLLAQRHISAVFVADADGRPLGVVSEGDLIRRLAPRDEEADLGWFSRLFLNADKAAGHYVQTHGTHARDVMSAKLVSVEEDDPAEVAAERIRQHRIRRVAVLKDGRLTGVVSRADLLKALALQPDRIGVATSDRRIQEAIQHEMQRHAWANERLTGVTVQNGVVRLEGYCRSEEARQALRVAAERVEGVRRVEDEMEISPLFNYPLYPPV